MSRGNFSGYLVLVVLVVGLVGCAATEKVDFVVPVWPGPPEVARYEFSGVLRTDNDITGAGRGVMERLSGVEGVSESPLFSKPYDVAARNGVVLVSDTVSRVVHMLVLPTRSIFRIGRSSGDGALTKPTGVALDGNGLIYVADTTGRMVKVYEPNTHYLMTIGGPDLFVRPTDVAVNEDGTRIYVVDAGGVESNSHQIQMFNEEGVLLKTIGARGGADGEFNLPTQAAVNAQGELFVLDAGNFRVQVFTAEGEYLRSWGKVGRNTGDFSRPRGLAIDAEGLIYVTDTAYGNFQVFRDDGQLMLAVGKSGADLPGEYSLPAGIAADEMGWVYILDQRYNKLEVIEKLKVEE